VVFVGPLLPGEEIIELLGQPAGDIDGIGGSEEKSFLQGAIAKGIFYEFLAIVEAAVYLECSDVFAIGRKLRFLDAADLAGGVKDDNVYAGHVVEAAGYGSAGITGGSDEDGYGFGITLHEVAEAAAHEAGADVFEGEGGTVVELEGPGVRCDGDQGKIEVDGFGDDAA